MLAGLALSAGCGSAADRGRPADTDAAAPPPEPTELDRLTPRQLVGQTVILTFQGYLPPPYVRRALGEGRAAGVILFKENVKSAEQLRSLTTALQQASFNSALVMTDQEGGETRILPFAGPQVGAGRQGSEGQAREQAAGAARDLRKVGVNVNLTPVVDVPSVPGAALASRSFSSDPRAVATRGSAAIRAYDAGRIAATAKHFPGLGAAARNTDDAPVSIPGPTETDLIPYRAAIAADVPLIMSSHALYPDLDRERIASQSPAVLTDLLRRRLGFRGVAITDSMEADAVLRRSDVPTAAERAMLAGADLLLFSGSGSFRPASLRLNALYRRSAPARARVREAAGRVLALKRRLRLQPPPGAP